MQDNQEFMAEETLEAWVESHVDEWQRHYQQNFADKHEEYMRIFKGVWAKEDSTRSSERSTFVSPASMQAVESSVAEVEEAIFTNQYFFDVKDDVRDEDNEDIQALRKYLHEDFAKNKVRKAIGEVLLTAAIQDIAYAEVVVEEEEELVPAGQPILGGELTAVGVNAQDRVKCKLIPLMPKNFFKDPNASSIDDGLGCGSDRFVPRHSIELLQEAGVYRDIHIPGHIRETDIDGDPDITQYEENKVRLVKYNGLVPTDLLKDAMLDEDEVEVSLTGDDTESMYTEAIVILANNVLIKAIKNPNMMGDRNFLEFAWDSLPGSNEGRGIINKGYNSQKGLDAELRARQDALALTVHPMMGVDATKLPRGAKLAVRPGKMLLTNGDPREVLHPMNFGQVDQTTFIQSNEFHKMLQNATGAIDNTSQLGSVDGGRTSAGASMAIAPIVKRHKRTLVNFTDSFLIPFINKAAWRYMQYDPDRYPVADYKFTVSGTLGIIAREYEVAQQVQLLQTMSQDSPLYPVFIQSIIDNMHISNSEELNKLFKQSLEPKPEEQQAAEEARQSQLAMQKSQENAFQGQANESNARAGKAEMETQLLPQKAEIDKIDALTKNLGAEEDKDFEQRLKLADTLLRERQVAVAERKNNA
mgnify:CR=1 FL=1|tara:strand:+ start:430 stop:2355 length:1926 start_codon:yes stop_codon:yes gene_type:complete